MNSKNKIFILVTLLALVLIGIPALVFLSQKKQDVRSNASASTTLEYTPNTNSSSPLQKTIGDNVSFDILLTPGNNQPSYVRLEITYDTSKLQATSSPFSVNTDAFPSTLEGPIVQNGKILISVSVGSDPSKAIKQITKVGTVNFSTISLTGTSPTQISYGPNTQILSVAAGDQANENVLSSTTPAYVSIVGIPTATPSPTPTPKACGGLSQACCDINPRCQANLQCIPDTTNGVNDTCQAIATPTPTTIPTPIPTNAPTQTPVPPTPTLLPPTPTPTSVSLATKISFTVFMHGIGNSGDNVSPNLFSLSNKNPLTKTRNAKVEILNASNALIATVTGNIVYDELSGNFKGTVDLGSQIPSTGPYTVKFTSSTHLRRLVPGIQNLITGQTNTMESITLVTGDVNSDNVLNILDYNLLIGCYSDFAPAASCTTSNKLLTDLNDDGKVNQFDYNLFLRELTVQNGQ